MSLFAVLLSTLSCLAGSGFAFAAEPDPSACQVKLEIKGSTLRGIYFLDQKGVGPVPGEFETAPGAHRIEIFLAGREGLQEKFSCEAGKEKWLRLKPGKLQAEPAWTQEGSRFQVSGEEMTFQGVGISGDWGANAWVQVLLADLRGRMDIIRAMDDQTASLRKDYEEKKDYHVENVTRSVIMFSWDAELVASRLKVEDRWLSPEGVLYSKVSLRLPRSALSRNNSPPLCSNQPRLVFFDERLDKKIVDQVVILCGPGEGFSDLGKALSSGEGEVWSAKDAIPAPALEAYCIGDIQRQGRCTEKTTDYVESIGLFRYPSLLPIGQLHKDYSSENPYGCEFR
jgi:hypothetical protein